MMSSAIKRKGCNMVKCSQCGDEVEEFYKDDLCRRCYMDILLSPEEQRGE